MDNAVIEMKEPSERGFVMVRNELIPSIKRFKSEDSQCELEPHYWWLNFQQGGRVGSPAKPPQGAELSRFGIERCGKDTDFFKDCVRYGIKR